MHESVFLAERVWGLGRFIEKRAIGRKPRGLKQVQNAGFLDGCLYRGLLRAGFQLRAGLSEVEVAMSFVTIVVLVLSVLLLGYLTATLLFPEKF